VTSWTDLLDAYEASVVALEQAVAAGEAPELPTWQEPDRTPAEPATDEHWQRFVRLQEREARCQAAGRVRLGEIREELADSRRTAAAAQAYANPGRAPRR
jgi:hypothetical protein